MPPRLKIGDVMEVQLPLSQGLAYVQYIGKDAMYGDAIGVSPMAFVQRPEVTEGLFKEGYVTFYPAGLAVRHGLAKIVGNVMSRSMPTAWRQAGKRWNRRVETWILTDESGRTVTRSLTEEQRQLPIKAIWNHEFLVSRIFEGWRPEKEG